MKFTNLQTNRSLSVQLEDLHIMDIAIVNMEPESRPNYMKTLYACRSGIDYQHIPFLVTHDLQYMGMSADKDVRMILIYQFKSASVVSSGIASDMGHQNLHSLTLKETMERMDEPKVMIVAIARHPYQRLETVNFCGKVHSPAEVSGMPYLIDRLKELLKLSVKYSVCV